MSTQEPATEDPAKEAGLPIDRMVAQAQSGDRVAFHLLADRFQGEIFRMIFFRTRSRMDAEDLTQDVFFKAFRSLGQLKSPHLFKSWLYRIAVNRVRDHYRRKAVKSMFGFLPIDDPDLPEIEELAKAPEVDRQIDRRAFWDQITQMMNALPKMEKEVFLLRFFDDLSIREISSVLQKNESTIKTHLYRALSKVKDAAVQMEGLLEGL